MKNYPSKSNLYLNFCLAFWVRNIPVDTGRKFNVHKTFRRGPGRLIYVLTSYLRSTYVLCLRDASFESIIETTLK